MSKYSYTHTHTQLQQMIPVNLNSKTNQTSKKKKNWKLNIIMAGVFGDGRRRKKSNEIPIL